MARCWSALPTTDITMHTTYSKCLAKQQIRPTKGSARAALQAPHNTRSYLSDLFGYWRIIHPTDYNGVLRQCYDSLSATPDTDIAHGQRDHARLSALLLLMAENENWAWTEFHRLFRNEQLPSNLPVGAPTMVQCSPGARALALAWRSTGGCSLISPHMTADTGQYRPRSFGLGR